MKEKTPGHKNPVITVDGIVLVDGRIVLVRRGRKPEKGKLALPGGIVEYGETVEEAIVREVREETGLDTKIIELMGVYSDPKRDPRGHFITLVYHLQKEGGELRPGDDAADVGLYELGDRSLMAFDHERIVADFLLRRKR